MDTFTEAVLVKAAMPVLMETETLAGDTVSGVWFTEIGIVILSVGE